MKKYTVYAKNYQFGHGHEYVIVTFHVDAFSYAEAIEKGRALCEINGVKYLKTRKREYACDFPTK